MRGKQGAFSGANGMIEFQGFRGEYIRRQLEAPRQNQLRQSGEVDDMGAAYQSEYGVRPNQFQKLARDHGLVFGCWRGQHEDQSRTRQQFLQRQRRHALTPQIAVAEPGIVSGDLHIKGAQKFVQFAGEAAIANHAGRLVVQHKGTDVAVVQILLPSSAHLAVANRNIAGRGDRHAQGKLRHLPRKSWRRAEHPYPIPIAKLIIQAQRKSAGNSYDGLELSRLIQDFAVAPVGADDKISRRQCREEILHRHRLVAPPEHID